MSLKQLLVWITISCLFLSFTTITNAQTWTQLSPTGSAPTTRDTHTAIYDSANNRMTIYGGDLTNALNDIYVLDHANGLGGTPSWTQLLPTGSAPSSRFAHTAMYDSANNRMIMYGGYTSGTYFGDVWILSNTNGLGGTPTWTQLSTISGMTTGRGYHSTVYDSANNKMIVFGGFWSGSKHNDTWVLSNANGLGGTPAWTELSPTGSLPTTRQEHTAVYDSVNNRMIIFGGYDGPHYNDVWVLTHANGLGGAPAWSQLLPSGSIPTTRSGHKAIYDAANNKMTIFGGYEGGTLNDTWVLSNANGLGGTPTWTQITTLGSIPSGRWEPSAIYDTTNNRMTIFGGSGPVTDLNDTWVLDYANGSTPPLPNIASLPALKLFVNQSTNNSFDLQDFNIGGSAGVYTTLNNFMGLATLNGSMVTQGTNGFNTSGFNTFIASNTLGDSTGNNKIKYSYFKIQKLPQITLHPGSSFDINLAKYTLNEIGPVPTSIFSRHAYPLPVYPGSFGSDSAFTVSDTTKVSVEWLDNTSIRITALPGFTSGSPVNVDVIASAFTDPPYDDQDKERIQVFPALSTTAFEFGNSSDTSLFSYQVPAGVSALGTLGYSTGISDPAGNDSHGGALKVTFATSTSGIKITPKFNTWLPNTPGTWYTLRVRVFGTNTINNYLQLLYNGNPGVSPTDVQGYFSYSMPTVWATFDIPVNSFSSVSSVSVMYPQVVLKANGATGTVYIDELELFKATPPLVNSRYITHDNYPAGLWYDYSATTKWSVQLLSGTAKDSVAGGSLFINTSAGTGVQSGLKFTASTTSGQVYTVSANIGRQAGMHIKTKLISGTPNVSLTQAQVNMLGASGPSLGTQSGDIAAAAEIGRISNRTLQLAFDAHNANYQVQFIVKSAGISTIQIDNTQADIDNDDPNYGDPVLFPN